MAKRTSLALLFLVSLPVFSDDNEKLQDMSDPLAVYTQAGVGYTNKGFNLKPRTGVRHW